MYSNTTLVIVQPNGGELRETAMEIQIQLLLLFNIPLSPNRLLFGEIQIQLLLLFNPAGRGGTGALYRIQIQLLLLFKRFSWSDPATYGHSNTTLVTVQRCYFQDIWTFQIQLLLLFNMASPLDIWEPPKFKYSSCYCSTLIQV